jgi:RNA-directed DNA polymerase
MEQVLDATNMQSAWQRVRRNGGAPGIDGMTIDEFPAFARQHWERIRAQLSEGSITPRRCAGCSFPNPMGRSGPSGFRRCWIE